MNDDVLLSRLLDGDLPPEEALALHARLAAEPPLAERLARLKAVTAALRELPSTMAPPGLPAALRRPPAGVPAAGPPARTASWQPWAAALLCAGLLLAAGAALRPAPAWTVLLDGDTVFDGRVNVLAAGVPVEVNGRARISVEPGPGAPRVDGAEVIRMNQSTLAAAFAGAAITVVVYEGTARFGADAAGEEVAAGEKRTLHLPGSRAETTEPGTPKASSDARIARLEGELAAARQEAGIQRAIVSQHEGTRQPWPGDVAPVWKEGAFGERLAGALAAVPGASLLRLDCAEFPCIAVLSPAAGDADWVENFDAVPESMNADGAYGEVGGLGLAAATGDGANEVRVYAMALLPDDAPPEAPARARYRAEALLSEFAAEEPDAAGQEAVDRLKVLGYL